MVCRGVCGASFMVRNALAALAMSRTALFRTRAVDLIVATVPKDIPGLSVQDLYREEVVLVVAKELLSKLYQGHEDEVVAEVERKGTLQPLADCPFLLLGKRDIPGDLARQAFRESGITPTIQVTSSNTETLLDLCALLCLRLAKCVEVRRQLIALRKLRLAPSVCDRSHERNIRRNAQ